MPLAGSILHDDVCVEALIGERRLYEPHETAVYRETFEHLLQAAAHARLSG